MEKRHLGKLIGRTIDRVSRVGVEELIGKESGSITAIDSTLLLHCSDGVMFELLVEQARALFAQVSPGADLSKRFDFDLYLNEPPTSLRTGVWLAELLSRGGLREVRSRDQANTFYVMESFELDDGQADAGVEVAIENIAIGLPKVVSSITEIWSGEGERIFLVGITLWDEHQQPFLCLSMRSHSIEVLPPEDHCIAFCRLPLVFGSVLHLWYDRKRLMAL